LKCLNISANKIETLQPEIFENLSNLTDLNISFNQISEIPIEISKPSFFFLFPSLFSIFN